MKNSFCRSFGPSLALLFLFLSSVQAAPSVGEKAPLFTGIDSNGQKLNLSDYKGKTVILEWTNHGCPWVARHYGIGNMQNHQKKAIADGVIWLSIISSAPGLEGYVDGSEANQLTKSRNAYPTRVILDPSGKIAKAYAARTTPHMYIISSSGTLIYQGGIDDDPTPHGEIENSTTNFIMNALAEIKAGKKVSKSTSQPYGCSVKYGS